MQKWLPPFDFPLAAVLNPDADATLLFINVNQKKCRNIKQTGIPSHQLILAAMISCARPILRQTVGYYGH